MKMKTIGKSFKGEESELNKLSSILLPVFFIIFFNLSMIRLAKKTQYN